MWFDGSEFIYLGAIKKISNTLGSQSVTKYHMGGEGWGKMSHDNSLLEIYLVKVNKNLYNITQGGKRNDTKCHILFEWPVIKNNNCCS